MINVAIIIGNRTVGESLETLVNLAPDCRCVGAWGQVEEALKALGEATPDVLLLDMDLPSQAGVEVVALAKANLPKVKILVATVYEDPDRIFGALEAGACGYLLKRSTPAQILSGIRAAHGRGHAGARAGG